MCDSPEYLISPPSKPSQHLLAPHTSTVCPRSGLPYPVESPPDGSPGVVTMPPIPPTQRSESRVSGPLPSAMYPAEVARQVLIGLPHIVYRPGVPVNLCVVFVVWVFLMHVCFLNFTFLHQIKCAIAISRSPVRSWTLPQSCLPTSTSSHTGPGLAAGLVLGPPPKRSVGCDLTLS